MLLVLFNVAISDLVRLALVTPIPCWRTYSFHVKVLFRNNFALSREVAGMFNVRLSPAVESALDSILIAKCIFRAFNLLRLFLVIQLHTRTSSDPHWLLLSRSV